MDHGPCQEEHNNVILGTTDIQIQLHAVQMNVTANLIHKFVLSHPIH